jgi:hypothetical protein
VLELIALTGIGDAFGDEIRGGLCRAPDPNRLVVHDTKAQLNGVSGQATSP